MSDSSPPPGVSRVATAENLPARSLRSRSVHGQGGLVLLPAAVLLVPFTRYQVAATLYHSFFSNPKPNRAAVWVGADNYRAMVEDPVFWQVVGDNVRFAVGTIPVSIA